MHLSDQKLTTPAIMFASSVRFPVKAILSPLDRTKSLRTSGSELNFCRAIIRSTTKKTLNNSSGESTHHGRSPCPTSNHSEDSTLSDRKHALIPSWSFRMSAILSVSTSRRVLQGPNTKGRDQTCRMSFRGSFGRVASSGLFVLEPLCPGNQILGVLYLLIIEHQSTFIACKTRPTR